MQEILEFFKKFTDSTSKDLQFVIDDLSTEDSSSVGVTWHLGALHRFYHSLSLFNVFSD